MKLYDNDNHIIKLSVQFIDTGGDRTHLDLADKLETYVRVNNYEEYTYSICPLHEISLTLSFPTNLIMGNGGLLKRNALRCLHTVYNLAQQHTSG